MSFGAKFGFRCLGGVGLEDLAPFANFVLKRLAGEALLGKRYGWGCPLPACGDG